MPTISRDAVAAITQAGGGVFYEWQWQHGAPEPSAKSPLPQWLIKPLGLDFFYRVKAVGLIGGKPDRVNDELMASVGRLRDLENLNLNGCKGVTDAGLAHLRGLTALEGLDLSFTGATGAGLKSLEGLTRLRKLELPFGRTTDADLMAAQEPDEPAMAPARGLEPRHH